MRPAGSSPFLAGRTNIPRMTPSEVRIKVVRQHPWHRWAVLEHARNLPFTWVVSFHHSRRAAARACGRRILRITALNTGGQLQTWITPVETEAVQSAIAARRIER